MTQARLERVSYIRAHESTHQSERPNLDCLKLLFTCSKDAGECTTPTILCTIAETNLKNATERVAQRSVIVTRQEGIFTVSKVPHHIVPTEACTVT